MTGMHADLHGHYVMALKPSSRVQNITYGASSTASTTFLAVQQNTSAQDRGVIGEGTGPSGTTHIRLCPSTDCYILVANNAVVTASNGFYLPAGSVEYVPVDVNDVVAVIQVAAPGTLNIAECS